MKSLQDLKNLTKHDLGGVNGGCSCGGHASNCTPTGERSSHERSWNNINLIGSKQGTTKSGSTWVNPSSDPGGKSGQLHIHPHSDGSGTTYSHYEGGKPTAKVTEWKK